MRWILFVGSLALGALLSIVAIALECPSCTRQTPVAWAGLAGYLGLLAIALWRGPNRLVYAGAFLAFGMHALLIFRMAQDRWCTICFLAAANSLLLAILAIACDRTNLKVAAWALPWSASLLVVYPRSVSPVVVPESAHVRITVLERENCSYCRELREDRIPRLEREFGDRIEVNFRPADEFPGVSKTPTLIVTRRKHSRVIEGLPPYDLLRGAIAQALEDAP